MLSKMSVRLTHEAHGAAVWGALHSLLSTARAKYDAILVLVHRRAARFRYIRGKCEDQNALFPMEAGISFTPAQYKSETQLGARLLTI